MKACDEETKEMVRQIFDEIVKQNEFTLEAWRRVRVKVIHRKKGDVEDVGNYRPICSFPALYKLFTTILYNRLYPRHDQTQAEDQAGFRSSYQTADHLATYRMIDQKCHECGIKMWAADNRLHEGVRLHHPQINLGRPQILQHRTLRDQERSQTGRFSVKLALQHSSAESIGEGHSALAKEKRNGNLLE